MDPGENLQEKAAPWYGVLEGSRVVTGAQSSCQAVRRKGREAACRPGKLELFQGCCQLCCKKLLLAGALHSLMGLGIFVSPFKGYNRCLPGCRGSGELYSQGRSVAKRNTLAIPRESEEPVLRGSIPAPKDVHAGPVS